MTLKKEPIKKPVDVHDPDSVWKDRSRYIWRHRGPLPPSGAATRTEPHFAQSVTKSSSVTAIRLPNCHKWGPLAHTLWKHVSWYTENTINDRDAVPRYTFLWCNAERSPDGPPLCPSGRTLRDEPGSAVYLMVGGVFPLNFWVLYYSQYTTLLNF